MSNLEWDEDMNRELARLRSEILNKTFRVAGIGIGNGELQPNNNDHLRQNIASIGSRQIQPVHQEPPVGSAIAPNRSDGVGPIPRVEFRNSKSEALHFRHDQDAYLAETTHIQSQISSTAAKQKRPVSRSFCRYFFYKYIKPHLIDMFFVIATFVIALCGFGFVVDGQHFATDVSVLRDWLPFRMLSDLDPLILLVGSYAGFLIYWLFFKLLVGSTMGQSIATSRFRSGKHNKAR